MDWNIAINTALENNSNALASLRMLLGPWASLPTLNQTSIVAKEPARASSQTQSCVASQHLEERKLEPQCASGVGIVHSSAPAIATATPRDTIACPTGRPTPAQDLALALPELLEPILAHLPLQELIRSQRVCILWRQMLQTSPRLQRAAFLRGETSQTSKPMRKNSEVDTQYAHHEYSHTNMRRGKEAAALGTNDAKPATSATRKAVLSPLLLPFTVGCMNMLPLASDFPLGQSKNASFHNLLLVQPALPSILIFWQRKGEEEVRTLDVAEGTKDAGARMRDLVRVLGELEKKEGQEKVGWVRVSEGLGREGLVEGWRC